MEFLSPALAYQSAMTRAEFVQDPSQAQAVLALENCYRALHSNTPGPSRGVYLWGPVGRGKTWLMDLFQRGLNVPSRRQHFHHFMQWVHRRLFALSGTPDPLRVLAQELASEVRVLCFDELFVSDIGDAALLGRLFQEIFGAGVVLVTTSNQPPQQLYAEGFNRDRFLPAITAIEQHMQLVPIDGDQDHRLHAGARQQRYWVSDPNALSRVFNQLSSATPVSDAPLLLARRPLTVVQYSDAAIWLRFSDLCDQPFGAADFIALCDRFPAILLGRVPALSASQRPANIARGTEDGTQQVVTGDRELPRLSVKDDSVRRFIALVDECYDRRVPLYMEAEVPLASLYNEGYLTFPFRRTLSRLHEMQLQRF